MSHPITQIPTNKAREDLEKLVSEAWRRDHEVHEKEPDESEPEEE